MSPVHRAERHFPSRLRLLPLNCARRCRVIQFEGEAASHVQGVSKRFIDKARR